MSRSQSLRNGNLSKRGNDVSYKVIAVNFHGKSLEPIRDEFLKMGANGARRRVIVVDIEKERRRVLEQRAHKKSTTAARSTLKRKTKGSFDLGDFSDVFLPTARSGYTLGGDSVGGGNSSLDVTVAMLAIQRLRREYDETSAILTKEREFDLQAYWQSALDKTASGSKRKTSLGNSKPIDKELLKKKRLTAIREDDDEMPDVVCAPLTPQLHNKVGRPPPLLKKKFIEDEPTDSKIFFILIGIFDNSFYFELVRRGEPLLAIMNFLPGESPYDLLLPNMDYKLFVNAKLDELSAQTYEMRKKSSTKPTGVFRIFLPKISVCLANKYARKIYDQLSWAFYDIEMLQRNYKQYYLMAFNMTNVAMPHEASLEEAYYKTASTTLHGSYLQNPFPAINGDAANVLLYMDMLFNTIDKPNDILTEWETVLLSTPLPKRIYSIYSESVNVLAKRYADAFYSITKIKKAERLFVEENNTMLTQMVRYVDHELFRHIYLACLEYKLQRKYVYNDYHRDAVPYRKYEEHSIVDFDLPNYAKLYATDDGLIQRLLAMLDDYDNYEISEFRPAQKLYEFTRNLNEITEHNRMFTIPTRLCFRDFTLFRLEEFLTALITSEMTDDLAGQNLTDMERFEMMMRRLAQDYNPDIFIRPNSLKARRLLSVSALLGLRASSTVRRLMDTARERELQMANDALMSFSSRKSSFGVPHTHPMLQGYNLENVRQEIWVKDTKYFFEEGNIQLYEEKWNFSETNKNLSFKMNCNTLVLGTPMESVLEIRPLLRLQTENDVSIRLQPEPKECAKIVVNYPNGLSVYYQENHTEQLWTREETPANEKRRIMTPYGAVVVHYHDEDMILVMRYNGEIYRLYQYEFDFGEGEGEAGEEMSFVGDTAVGSGTGTGTGNVPDYNTFTSTNSRFLLQMLQKEHGEAHDRTDRSDYSRIPPEARPMKVERPAKRSSKRRESRKSGAGGDNGPTLSLGSSLSLGSYVSDREPDLSIVTDELRFVKQIMAEYDFGYKHLIITTTTGRIFNLMETGRFYESTPIRNEEWHDYFVNESYAMRDDGVRMIWGMDYLKCFHADGTVIHTMTDDVLHTFDFGDEFASAISESSSHKNYEDATIGDGPPSSPRSQKTSPTTKNSRASRLSINRERSTRKMKSEHNRPRMRTKRGKTYEPYLKATGEFEEESMPSSHPGYVCALIGRQECHHRNYACVYFLPHFINYEVVRYVMEIKGANEIIIQKAYEPPAKDESSTHVSSENMQEAEEKTTASIKSTYGDGAGDGPISPLLQSLYDDKDPSLEYMDYAHLPPRDHSTTASFAASKSMHMTSPVHSSGTTTSPTVTPFSRQTPTSGSQMVEEQAIQLREVLKVWIGTDYYVVATEEDIELQAVINKESVRANKEKVRSTIKFKVAYVENLQDVFHMIVAQIASYKKYASKTMEKVYFLEKVTKDCNLKGLEFMDELPDLGKYHFEMGNTITQFTELETIFERFAKNFDWFDKDMAKFPRFRTKPEKSKTPLDEFPMVLSVNLYLKIPALLRSTFDIHKFTDPLDRVNFKKTRYQIKETMNHFIYPYLNIEVHKLSSSLSWRSHHEEKLRRKLIVAQRRGLYHAMLRHKTYPKYFLFRDKFNSRAECIDYFDFCLENCKEKPKWKKTILGEPSPRSSATKKEENEKPPQQVDKVEFLYDKSQDDQTKLGLLAPTSQIVSPVSFS